MFCIQWLFAQRDYELDPQRTYHSIVLWYPNDDRVDCGFDEFFFQFSWHVVQFVWVVVVCVALLFVLANRRCAR